MKKTSGLISVLALTLIFSVAAEAKSKKKMGQSQAKKECLKDDSSLSGKALRQCIKERRK